MYVGFFWPGHVFSSLWSQRYISILDGHVLIYFLAANLILCNQDKIV